MTNSETTNTRLDRDIYGSFLLGESEFAISVKAIQEVVNEPESYNPVPLAPDYLLGLFNLRGMIIPVIDLRKLFGISSGADLDEKKVAIIEHGSLCVGILFDCTREVFDGNTTEKSLFKGASAQTEKEKVIEGVFKLDQGQRMIQIINPYELLSLQDLPKTDESVAKTFSSRKTGKREQCISFRVGDSLCALGIHCIQEIVKVEAVEHTALSNEICLGAINIRGNTIPVINFERIFGYDNQTNEDHKLSADSRIVIMKLEDELFGLLVSSIQSIVSYFSDEVIAFPVLNKKKKEMFIGCLPGEDEEQTILLDHTQVLSNAEIERITKGHSNLYREKSGSASENAKKN
ncbi:MAG: chemotaxis protein CheW, partial [Pseudomonadota bacterium]